MKVARVTAPQNMIFSDEQLPVICKDEALVRIVYTGICGSDVHIYKGETPSAKQNVVVGHEYSGIIEHIGEHSVNPNGLKAGDKVVGWIVEACGVCDACISGHTNLCRQLKCYGTQIDGTFREYISAPLHMLYKLPDSADLRLYALVEPLAVAVYAVRETPVLLGDTVFVIGGGPIGVYTALAAREAGASLVVVSEIEDAKIARIQSMGFQVINPKEQDAVAEAKRLTSGHGFNCVLEATATAAGYELMTKVGSYRAKGMNIGVSIKPVPIIPREIMVTEMRIKAIRIHQQSTFGLTVDLLNHAGTALIENLYKSISHDFVMENLPDGFAFCVQDRTYCKVMVQVTKE